MFNIASPQIHQIGLELHQSRQPESEIPSPSTMDSMTTAQRKYIEILGDSMAFIAKHWGEWLPNHLREGKIPTDNYRRSDLQNTIMDTAHYFANTEAYDAPQAMDKDRTTISIGSTFLDAHFQEWAVDTQIGTNSIPYYSWFGGNWLNYKDAMTEQVNRADLKGNPKFLMVGSLGVPSAVSFANLSKSLNQNTEINIVDLDTAPTRHHLERFTAEHPDTALPKINFREEDIQNTTLQELYRILSDNGTIVIIEEAPLGTEDPSAFQDELIQIAESLGFNAETNEVLAINYDYKTKTIPDEEDLRQEPYRKESSVVIKLTKKAT